MVVGLLVENDRNRRLDRAGLALLKNERERGEEEEGGGGGGFRIPVSRVGRKNLLGP